MSFRTCLLIALMMATGPCLGQKIFEVRYLGNMGIALVHNDSAIIIDGLHDFYEKGYLPTDPAAVNAMMQKQTPYKTIVAIAVTHKHNDHFDSAIVSSVANVHKAAVITGGSQTGQLLGSDLQRRFIMSGDNKTIVIKPNLVIKLNKIAHTYPKRHAAVENYRVEVEWNGFRLIHLGDADVVPGATTGLASYPGVIVVPEWFISGDGLAQLEVLNPANILVTHIPPSTSRDKINEPRRWKPVLTVFTKYGDTKTVEVNQHLGKVSQ